MTDVVLSPISSGYNLSIINANFTKVQQKINEEMLHLTGGNNTMLQQLDMNNNKLINVFTDVNDPNSLITVGTGDSRWYNVAGDTLTGTMNAGGQRVINLPAPISDTEPMRRADVLAIDSGNALQLKIDLANAADVNKGSTLVGFYDPISPAYLKTVSDIINMEPVNVLRLVPKGAETTALHNGTSTFPLAARLNALIQTMNAIGGGKIELTYGTHRLESYVEFLSNVRMEGLGDTSVFKGMFASPINRMITSPALVGQTNIALKNFKVDRTALNTEHGVILGGIDGLTIDNVTVWGFRPEVTSGAMGISPFNEFATIQSKNVHVKRCHIYQPNNFGIAYGNVSGGTLSKCMFTDAWREAIGLETWGATSVVEDIVADSNILRMSTRVGNHFGGSVGPAVLIGGAGASYAGLTRRCTLSKTIISIDNAGALPDYRGIVVVGGLTEGTAAEDITIDTNTIYGAPGSAMAFGAGGSVTRRIRSKAAVIHEALPK